jgi:flagellar hook-basal body complex protein FliE
MPQVAQRVRDSAQAAGLTPARSPSTQGVGKGEDFSVAFSQALRNVSQTQNTAQALQREVALDNPAVSIEQTMIAMQRSQIGFQAALQVRNRLVQAYSDIMNMQV